MTTSSAKLLRLLLPLLCVSFFFTACDQDDPPVDEPLSTPTAVREMLAVAPTSTPATVATDTPAPPTPTPIPEPEIVLPAPVYFLSDGQIQRLETDGLTLTQLTQEAEPITDFDVSPIDASLVYVTGNDLIEANPQYGTRLVKVDGESFDPNVPADAITRRISAPRFSPDGSQIAFGLNGVNLIDAGDALTVTTVLESDPYPDPNNPPRGDVRFFFPGSWSPAGASLLVNFSYWPEAGGLAILDLSNGSLISLTSDDPNIPVCCDWAWGRDIGRAFIASNLLAYGIPGLAQVNTTNGATTLLIPGSPEAEISAENPLRLFRSPYEMTTGNLLVFVSELSQMEEPAHYVLAQVEATNNSLLPLRKETFEAAGDILWARDDSGAALIDVTTPGIAGQAGPILWVPLNGDPIVELPALGEQLRWGPSAMTPALTGSEETAIETADSTQGEAEEVSDPALLTAQVLVNVRSGPSTAYDIVGELAEGEEARITGVSPDGGWWQIVYPPDSEDRAWVIGDLQFTQAQNAGDVAVVTPPPLPRSVGRIFYSAPGPDGLLSIMAQSLAPGAVPTRILANASQPALYRNGQRLALRSSRSDLLGIGVYDLATNRITGITSHLEDSVPNWSPNGDRLVFASTRHGDRRWRVYTVPADGNQTAQELTFGLDPDWHPSAEQIVYKGCDDRGEACGLWLMDSSGRNRAPLTEDRTDSRPVWSADGRTIVFMSEGRHGNWEIYSVDASGALLTRLTADAALDGLPAVSPDGTRVAFVSNRGGAWGIWVVPLSGGTPQQVISIGPDLPNWLEQGIDWAE
jgi:Tol biopolymer transport system component